MWYFPYVRVNTRWVPPPPLPPHSYAIHSLYHSFALTVLMAFVLRCVGTKNRRHSIIHSLDGLEIRKLWVKTWNLHIEINFNIWCHFVPVLFFVTAINSSIKYWHLLAVCMLFVHLFASPVETSHVYCHWQMHNNLLHVRRPQQKPCSYANTSRYLPDLWPMQRDRWRYLQNSKNPAPYPQ
jgi:hypothetical protein